MSALEKINRSRSLDRRSLGHEVGNLGIKAGAGLAIYFVSFTAFIVYLIAHAILLVRNISH